MSSNNYNNALPPEYELLWYRIEGVLGQGAFGITYLAHDVYLDRQVAIKEYMPGQFSMRLDNERIEPISDDLQKDYQAGLERFLSEARTLTKFKHTNLVQVFNIFEKNNTAYMVMSYEVGKSLKQVLKARKSLGELELMRLLVPLMDGLEMMHDKGFIHRDIKPGNIFIRADNSPVLLDFGSARQTHYYFSDDEDSQVQTLTNFVSPGYTPIEQYTGKSNRQGPWTDIYALGATLYKCITGKMPIEAVERSESIVHVSVDEYIKLTDIADGKYSKSFLTAIDHSLAFKAQNRPQTIKEWKMEFGITEEEIDTIEMSKVHIDKYKSELGESDLEQTNNHDEPTTLKHEITATEETVIFDDDTDITYQNKKRTYFLPYAAAATFLLSLMYTYSWIDLNEQDVQSTVESLEVTTTHNIEKNKTTSSSGINSNQYFTNTVNKTIEKPAEQIVATVNEVPEKEVEAAPKKEILIQQLLSQAADDIQAKRYTVPKHNNAYEKYKKILVIDDNNADAKSGILLLTDKYMISTYKAIDDKKFSKARYFIAKANEISPGLAAVDRARDHLNRKQKQHMLAKTTVNKPPKPTATQNQPTNSQVTDEKVTIENGIKVVDLSREVPVEQSDSIPDNEIDRTIKTIKNIFE